MFNQKSKPAGGTMLVASRCFLGRAGAKIPELLTVLSPDALRLWADTGFPPASTDTGDPRGSGLG